MSLILIEGYDDGLASDRIVAGNPSVGSPGRTGANSMRSTAQYVFGTADEHATFVVGCAVRMDLGTTWDLIQLFGDNNATQHVRLRVLSSGVLEVYRGGIFLADTDPVINVGVWHYVELYAVLSDTVGEIKIRVDDKVPPGWSDLTNQDTKNGGTGTVFDAVRLATGSNRFLDDLYVLNGAGTVNNDLLGDVKVETLYPSGNGNYSQLTGSDGNSTDNYLLVDEATPSTSDYVGSATDGNKDTYAFDDLSISSGTVHGVMVSMYAAKTDTGAKSCRAVARRSAADATGDDKTLQTSYDAHDQVWDEDPTDATAWSVTKVNDSEFGFEVRP